MKQLERSGYLCVPLLDAVRIAGGVDAAEKKSVVQGERSPANQTLCGLCISLTAALITRKQVIDMQAL